MSASIFHNYARIAKEWRDEHHRHGWVLLYSGEVCGWCAELTDDRAASWCPGVRAVGPEGAAGKIYAACGGDDERGAEKWGVAWDPQGIDRTEAPR